MQPGIELLALSLLAAAALVLLALWIASWMREHTPERLERKRRQFVNQRGRLGDAFITEANSSTIFYSYSVQGVQYTASQEITALRDRLPVEPERLIGAANMKYAVRNPANSILLCEEWSGLPSCSPVRGNIVRGAISRN